MAASGGATSDVFFERDLGDKGKTADESGGTDLPKGLSFDEVPGNSHEMHRSSIHFYVPGGVTCDKRHWSPKTHVPLRKCGHTIPAVCEEGTLRADVTGDECAFLH
jgi:hypothetical protein